MTMTRIITHNLPLIKCPNMLSVHSYTILGDKETFQGFKIFFLKYLCSVNSANFTKFSKTLLYLC